MSGTAAPIQRAVTFPARFDVKRIADIAELRRKGPRQGRYKEIYAFSTNSMDHSIDSGDLLFQLKDGTGLMQERYLDAERNKTMLSQQPAVSCNLRGSTCDLDTYEKYAVDGGGDENAILRRVMRDSISVIGVARYNCLFNPETNDQKDVGPMVSGTIDSVVQHTCRTGDQLMWDVPKPGSNRQKAGKRDIKKLDKIRVEIVPIRETARLTIAALVDWCEKVNSEAAVRLFKGGDLDQWITEMTSYIGNDSHFFWTKEGDFLFTLCKNQKQFWSTLGQQVVQNNPALRELNSFDRWLRIIYQAKQYKHSFRMEEKECYYVAADGELYAQVRALLDCQGRSIGYCTRGAEPGGYADWVVEMM